MMWAVANMALEGWVAWVFSNLVESLHQCFTVPSTFLALGETDTPLLYLGHFIWISCYMWVNSGLT